MIEKTQQWLKRTVDRSLARPTRIHPLPSCADDTLYIKREDELSSGISGSKIRKYASLIQYLKKEGIQLVAIIGGPNSNNVVGLLQILKEAGIQPLLFLREAADSKKQGNALFLDMLAPGESVTVIARKDWNEVEQTASVFLSKQDMPSHLIPEGAFCLESLPGCLTLAEDLLRNETTEPFFSHIYIDSGTGMSAIGLILGLAVLDQKYKHRRIHISLIAGNEEEFTTNLESLKQILIEELNIDSLPLPIFDFLHPPVAKKFGSVNASLFQACRDIAKTEGLLMDPTYSVKHYMAMQEHRKNTSTTELGLFIFNGSALGLTGFQEQLGKT